MILRTILAFATLAAAEMSFQGGYWKRSSGGGGRSTFVIPLSLDGSGFYHSHVRMGSDDQHFNFSLSGSTGYTIVAGQVCSACGDQTRLYSSSNSSSFQSLNSLLDTAVDGVNQVFGNLAKENCGLHQSNGSWWNYTNQTILIANSVNDGTREVFNPDIGGILGLSPIAQTRTAVDTLLGAWLSTHPNAQNVSVGFALKRPDMNDTTSGGSNMTTRSTTDSAMSAGEMHMLTPDSDAYDGELSYSQVTLYESTGGPTEGTGGGQQMQSAGWSTTLEEWKFLNANGEQVAGGQGAVAAIDPWYPSVIMPKSQSESIFAKIPYSQLVTNASSPQQIWNIPCNASMNLTISIAGIDFQLDPRDLIVAGDTAANPSAGQAVMCQCSVRGWGDASVPGYMLGSSFMRNAYIVYNNAQPNSSQQNSIGFGRRFPFHPPSEAQEAHARKTGIIVGTVLGVVVLLGGGALTWFWIYARQRARRAPSEEFMDKGPSGFNINPGAILSAYTNAGRRGPDPESYPLMETPPTTSSPPHDGRPPRSFADQQQIHRAPAEDVPQELDAPAHEAYLARIAKHMQDRRSGSDTAGGKYVRIAEQDDDGTHAYGDYAPGQRNQREGVDPQVGYDPQQRSSRSTHAWDQPYYPPAPPSGGRVAMAVEPITKPAEAAREETRI